MCNLLNEKKVPFHNMTMEEQHAIIKAMHNNEYVEFYVGEDTGWVKSMNVSLWTYAIYRINNPV